MKNDFEILERKFKELNLAKMRQNEELQKVHKEKTAVDSQNKESEKLLIQERAKVANLDTELLNSRKELQLKTAELDEFKLSMREYFMYLIIYVFIYVCI